MSNHVHIEPTEFINTRTGHKTVGLRIFDDMEQNYINHWDSIPDDDLELLDKLLRDDCNSPTIDSLLDYAFNSMGVCIGPNWYTHEQIRPIFDATDDVENEEDENEHS